MDFPILLITIIGLALIFDYINGFHDAANSIATIVSTKVLTPFQAVLWAALWNFAAFFLAVFVFGGFKIGNTIAKIVNENFITLEVIFSGLVAAISWNLLTWWLGIPSSSSHTLIGGFLGAALTHAFIGNYNEIRAAPMIPITFWASLSPCPKLNKAEEANCNCLKVVSALCGLEFLHKLMITNVITTETNIPMNGAKKINKKIEITFP